MEARKLSLPLLIILLIAAALIGGFFTLLLSQTPLIREALPAPISQGEQENAATGNAAATAAEKATAGKEAAAKILPSVVGIKANGGTLHNGAGAVTESSGSGVIIDERGYIITNYHVIAESDSVSVIFADDSEADAELIAADRRTDLALLKTEKTDVTAATLSTDKPRVGETAYAVGSPGGIEFAGTVTKGIVSGLDRLIVTDDGNSFSLIQTDAAVNPGNSGGALCNEKGEVIGINTIKISESGFEGMGFAIPIETAKSVATELLTNGTVDRGALGVYLLSDVDESIAANYHLGIEYGVVISLQEEGAAAKAGLKDYDIITAFNGETLKDMYDLQQKVFTQSIGDAVTVTVYRDGAFYDYSIILEELREE